MCAMKGFDGSNPPLSANEFLSRCLSTRRNSSRVVLRSVVRLSRHLLTVGNVGLEHSNGARDQQYDDTQRNENLHHSE
jgi:hypothetical protein